MIALRLLPLVLLAGTAHAQMTTRDVPPPRLLKPVELAMTGGPIMVPATYRETPPVMYGSNDRYIPVMRAPRMSACRAAALVGMIGGDDDMGFDDGGWGDDGDFAEVGFGDDDDGYFGR